MPQTTKSPGNKLQIPNSKLQRSPKLQAQKPTCAALAAAFVFEVWCLRFGISLELGVWSLGVSSGPQRYLLNRFSRYIALMIHVGIGYDVHRLVDGFKLILGGLY